MTESRPRRFELLGGMAHRDLLTHRPGRVSLSVRGRMPADDIRRPWVNLRRRFAATHRRSTALAGVLALARRHVSWVARTADLQCAGLLDRERLTASHVSPDDLAQALLAVDVLGVAEPDRPGILCGEVDAGLRAVERDRDAAAERAQRPAIGENGERPRGRPAPAFLPARTGRRCPCRTPSPEPCGCPVCRPVTSAHH